MSARSSGLQRLARPGDGAKPAPPSELPRSLPVTGTNEPLQCWAGTAWTVSNVLVAATVLGFSVAAWGVYKVTPWWERLAVGSAIFGFAPLIPYWIAAHAVSGSGNAAFVIAIHVVGNAAVLLLLLVPSLEHWVQERL